MPASGTQVVKTKLTLHLQYKCLILESSAREQTSK